MIQQAKAMQLTVREIIESLELKYPWKKTLRAWSDPGGSGTYCYQITFENGWTLSLNFDDMYKTISRLCGLASPLDYDTVQVAIFRPDGTWYHAEGSGAEPEDRTSVLEWQDAGQVLRIADYVSQMNPAKIPEGRIR